MCSIKNLWLPRMLSMCKRCNGLKVMGGHLHSKGCGLEFQHQIMYVYLWRYVIAKIVMRVWKRPKINQKEAGKMRLRTHFACKFRGQSYKQFILVNYDSSHTWLESTPYYDSRVVNYDFKMFIRLAIGHRWGTCGSVWDRSVVSNSS